jgi:hypothetical protein
VPGVDFGYHPLAIIAAPALQLLREPLDRLRRKKQKRGTVSRLVNPAA